MALNRIYPRWNFREQISKKNFAGKLVYKIIYTGFRYSLKIARI